MKSVVAVLLTVLATQAAPLPRATPESHGVSSLALTTFFQEASALEALHSAMILRHGDVIAEGWWAPYAPSRRHKLYSLSKSFTSTAVGLAIAEGKLSLDDTVLSFFPNDAPKTTNVNLKNMRVRDLLTMSTGHVSGDLAKFSFTESKEPLIKAFLHLPVAHKPGTHFLYNTPATYMCSAIVHKVTGQSTHNYLKTKLFEPLGIEDSHWETCPQGISLGGFGLNVKTEDIAKLGQLYLQRGEWQGKRLLPSSWVEAATSKQTSNGSNPDSDWDQGYGYQFWRCRHGAYRGDGAFGQFCIVFPHLDVVVAITSGTDKMQEVMNLVWDHLLPALAPVPLPSDPQAHAVLTENLAKLRFPPLEGAPFAMHAKTFSNQRFALAPNPYGLEEVQFDTQQVRLIRHATALTMEDVGMAMNTRLDVESAADTHTEMVWASPATLVSQTYYTRSPYVLTLTLTIQDAGVTMQPEWNVAFGPKALEPLRGTLKP